MRKNNYPGKFIVFDGLDGSGLSTQAELLVDFLNRKEEGLKSSFPGADLTKEPTKGLIGGLINAQLDGAWSSSNTCLQLLFSADRAYHLEKKIIPLLEKGVWVVCDRYFFSTVAFGQLNGVSERWLLELQKNFLMPDASFFLRVAPKECIRRITDNRFRVALFEKEKVLARVWKNYEVLAEKFENTYVLDGERRINEISEEIKNIIKDKFKI